jgi:thioredoxin reductase (NADPH)
MVSQVTNFGAEIKGGAEVTGLKKLDDGNIEITCDEDVYVGRSVVLAPGSSYRQLGAPGEQEFRNAGAGVSYCGTCDAPFFKGRKVVAIGGGNTAIEEALHLAKFASEVVLIHRRQEFRATRVLTDELMAKVNEEGSNLSLILDSTVTAIEGEGKVESVKVKNVKTDEEVSVSCDGAFIFIGMVPNTSFLEGFVEMTEHGFIKCDPAYLRTAIPGVFVAGDCRVGAAMQLITAVADGVNAAMWMKQYFRDANWWNEPVSDVLQPGGW